MCSVRMVSLAFEKYSKICRFFNARVYNCIDGDRERAEKNIVFANVLKLKKTDVKNHWKIIISARKLFKTYLNE